jgi:hypothetical protein
MDETNSSALVGTVCRRYSATSRASALVPKVLSGGPDPSNFSSRHLNCSRTPASVANQAPKRRVKLGTLYARDTPIIAANSALVAAVRRRAK